ncbi:claudin-4-like isoform X1 [Stigmatopora nigra]
MKAKLEMTAAAVGFLGLVGLVTSAAAPMWRVSAFIGANLIVMEVLWEGLWMNCYNQAEVRMQCKLYDSMLILPRELKAARGLMVVAAVVAALALLLAALSTRAATCCRAPEHARAKNATLASAAALYLLSCLLALVPVCWVAHGVIREFYSPLVVESRKRELGASIFVGWAACGLLLVAAVLLLVSCRRRTHPEPRGSYLKDGDGLGGGGGGFSDKDGDGSDDKDGYGSGGGFSRTSSSFYKYHEYV